MRSLLLIAAAGALSALPSSACTIFFAAKAGLVLAGNNEDIYLDKVPIVWVRPGGDAEHGRITFGFEEPDGKVFAQGGVNDAGLFFDAAVTPKVGKAQRRKERAPENMGDAMLAECASVDEAVAWLEARDLRLLVGSHLLLGDKSGGKAVVELIEGETKVIRSDKDYIAATNFSFSKPEAGNYPCPRFDAVRLAFGGNEAPPIAVNVENFEAILESTAVPRTRIEDEQRDGGTLYSNIYDLTRGTIRLYRESNWKHPVDMDVSEWLARGEQTLLMDSLFREVEAPRP